MTVKERFLKYVSFYTTSDENSETVPSTARQKALGRYLADELNAMGATAGMDAMGYVYGWLPPTAGTHSHSMPKTSLLSWPMPLPKLSL